MSEELTEPEFADVEHEAAGLLTTDRRAKDWGGCVPADVNAETVLVLDLVPLAAGADIEPPSEPFEFAVRVSHHGRSAVSGTVTATWVPFGAEPDTVPDIVDAESGAVTAEPFVLSDAVTLRVPAVDGPARLVLRFVDGDRVVRARAYVDAAEVEPVNRRAARAGEFEGWARPGED